MIRDAKFADIPVMVGLLREAFHRSHYAKDARCEVDVRELKRLLMAAIQRHGHRTGGGCWVQVSETDGNVKGMIVGTLSRAYSMLNVLMATDLFWYASPDVNPVDPMKLMAGMVEWAKSNPDVVEVRCGTTSVIMDDPRRPGLILERLGMKHYGEIYRMELG